MKYFLVILLCTFGASAGCRGSDTPKFHHVQLEFGVPMVNFMDGNGFQFGGLGTDLFQSTGISIGLKYHFNKHLNIGFRYWDFSNDYMNQSQYGSPNATIRRYNWNYELCAGYSYLFLQHKSLEIIVTPTFSTLYRMNRERMYFPFPSESSKAFNYYDFGFGPGIGLETLWSKKISVGAGFYYLFFRHLNGGEGGNLKQLYKEFKPNTQLTRIQFSVGYFFL
ncbi:MAG: outer membrane beta-barrel protein [Bacteroidetes bacterium]|nr:outer membrane beta-barrel protein [Bacteroidota bacterium]